MRITPSTTRVVIVSFEGPDRYSTVGGLATRVTDLVPALVERGYDVTHVFVGDPTLPADENVNGARLVRWGQWISRQHQRDVYDGEWGKWRDLSDNLPRWLIENAVETKARTILLFEDWQTAEAAYRTAELAYVRGAGRRCIALWNANNTYGCGGIDFGRLQMTVHVTTVSRWMRTELQQFGVADAIVIPNGIAERMVAPVTASDATALRGALDAYLVFLKVARFDRDKRWLGAIDAIAELKRRRNEVRFLFRGSAAPYRDEVLTHLHRRELSVTSLRPEGALTARAFAGQLAAMREDAGFLDFFVPERMLRALYSVADGVLANSAREPFGLVGLEVMGTGGIAYVGTTGEDYAQPLGNTVVVRTEDAREVADAAEYLRARPELAKRIRTEGRQTAKRYAWPRVIDDMELVWEYAAERAAGA